MNKAKSKYTIADSLKTIWDLISFRLTCFWGESYRVSINIQSVPNYVPHVPTCHTCFTCLHVLRAHVPSCLYPLRAFLFLRVLHPFPFFMCLHFFTYLTYRHFLRALRAFIVLRSSLAFIFYVPNVPSLAWSSEKDSGQCWRITFNWISVWIFSCYIFF